MGELLYCNEPITALPYYVEGISWNLYSLEELCYYIENNPYLIDKDFMNEELCTWIGKEVKNIKLAERLRDLLHMEGALSEFVRLILTDCGYTPKEKIKSITQILKEMEEISDFERNKLRADRLMEKNKYLGSILEYKRLLENPEAFQQEPRILGNIWHNLGVAYSRMFLFQEAIHCFETAYKLNADMESLKECLLAYGCNRDEMGFLRTAEKYFVSDKEQQMIRQELTEARHSQEIINFEEQLEKIVSTNPQAVGNIIFNWKEEYRRLSRI